MNERISVITGGTGYVGLALVKYLTGRGEKVRLLLLDDHPCLAGIDCEKIIGNICNPADLDAAFAGAETVYHIAGVVDISGKKEQLMWNVNVGGTKNVVESCRKNGVKNLNYVSSIDRLHKLLQKDPHHDEAHDDHGAGAGPRPEKTGRQGDQGHEREISANQIQGLHRQAPDAIGAAAR